MSDPGPSPPPAPDAAAGAGPESIGITIPLALVQGPGRHALVRVELTNGAIITGRIAEMDPDTMNLRLEAISHTAVRRIRPSQKEEEQEEVRGGAASARGRAVVCEVEEDPVALRCIRQMVIRGSHVRYLDFVEEEGGDFDGVLAALEQFQPTTL